MDAQILTLSLEGNAENPAYATIPQVHLLFDGLILLGVCLFSSQPAMAADAPGEHEGQFPGHGVRFDPCRQVLLWEAPSTKRASGGFRGQHPVTISRPFYMQTTEVTVDQWRAVMGRRFFARKKGAGRYAGGQGVLA
jgi:hypothetical protein